MLIVLLIIDEYVYMEKMLDSLMQGQLQFSNGVYLNKTAVVWLATG